MNLFQRVHDRCVHQRRVRVLARHFDAVLPPKTHTLLDVGCGDGRLARELVRLRPHLKVEGMDVMARSTALIPVTVFDGRSLPLADGAVDVVLLADVLHRAEEPTVVLGEAGRVSRLGVAIKDHLLQGVLAKATLSLMDWVGNASHGVALPYHYRRPTEWQAAFKQLGLRPGIWRTRLGLYPVPVRLLLDRSLHFVTFLESDRRDGSPDGNACAVEQPGQPRT